MELSGNFTLESHHPEESPLIRQVLSTVDAARSTNCYVCMYVCMYVQKVCYVKLLMYNVLTLSRKTPQKRWLVWSQ